MSLILTSQSPRRHDILNWMGIQFETEVCNEPENIEFGLSPAEMVKSLAFHKACYSQKLHPDDYILGADTIVVLDDVVLGKPASKEQAFQYLRMLQGKTHIVYTGVALLHNNYIDIRSCSTEVTFRKMTDTEIRWYIDTNEPSDKAGAYGIQGLGCVFVDGIKGNYFNVIGLPAPLVYEMLIKAGYMTEDRIIQK